VVLVHLNASIVDETLARSNNPSVSGIGKDFSIDREFFVKDEGFICCKLPAVNSLKQEFVCIVPRKEDALLHSEHSFFFKAHLFTSNQLGVDHVKPNCVYGVSFRNF
jgi:hypothetical protein